MWYETPFAFVVMYSWLGCVFFATWHYAWWKIGQVFHWSDKYLG